MEYLDTVKTLYRDYLEHSVQLQLRANPFFKLLNLRGGASDDPTHQKFLEDLDRTLSSPGEIPREELSDLVWFLLKEPQEHTDDAMSYWTLIAAQRSAVPLVPLLSPGEAAAMRDWYGGAYPRNKRLPIQKQLFDALQKQAG